jgi:hypothetical protein
MKMRCLDRTRGLLEVEDPRIFKQSAREGGKVVSPRVIKNIGKITKLLNRCDTFCGV